MSSTRQKIYNAYSIPEIYLSWRDRDDNVVFDSKAADFTKCLQFEEFHKKKIIGQVFRGDNGPLMISLLTKYRGKIDLIYLDPPFKTGKDFSTTRTKSQVLAYSDKFLSGEKSYWQFLWERLQIMYQLLSPRGALYLHTDYRTSSHLKLMLLELFGESNYVNEIIWAYKTGGNSKVLGFARKHDTIHYCVKNKDLAQWNTTREKSYLSHKYGFKNIKLHKDDVGIYNLVAMRDVWEIPALRGNQPERVDYPTQKPLALLERIISASTKPGDLVADFFCGSGTTGVAAKNLNRRYLLVDSGAVAIKTSVSRLKSI
jgi:DNA modification methylase